MTLYCDFQGIKGSTKIHNFSQISKFSLVPTFTIQLTFFLRKHYFFLQIRIEYFLKQFSYKKLKYVEDIIYLMNDSRGKISKRKL
jgi:hypothetical protein